jgi:hypothetical protein
VPQVLRRRELGRALLARQMLLERADAAAEQALTRLTGMQAQAPYAPYFGLWSRLRRFGLSERRVVRVALMRSTVHLVSADDYRTLRPWAQPALDQELDTAYQKQLSGLDRAAVADAGRTLLATRQLTPSNSGPRCTSGGPTATPAPWPPWYATWRRTVLRRHPGRSRKP